MRSRAQPGVWLADAVGEGSAPADAPARARPTLPAGASHTSRGPRAESRRRRHGPRRMPTTRHGWSVRVPPRSLHRRFPGTRSEPWPRPLPYAPRPSPDPPPRLSHDRCRLRPRVLVPARSAGERPARDRAGRGRGRRAEGRRQPHQGGDGRLGGSVRGDPGPLHLGERGLQRLPRDARGAAAGRADRVRGGEGAVDGAVQPRSWLDRARPRRFLRPRPRARRGRRRQPHGGAGGAGDPRQLRPRRVHGVRSGRFLHAHREPDRAPHRGRCAA